MKARVEYLSFYLLIGILFLAISFTVAFTCPEHCSCVEIPRKRYAYNHAQCTSLDGLRNLGKTSELHSLDLSSLNLTKINNQLDKLTNLSKLDLADNRLSEINVLSTKRIRVLNLSGNRIPSGKLSKIPSTVKTLNLSNNDITVLTENFKRFVQLRSLELADNPLNCTCETLEIRNWLQERQVWTEKPILCMAPQKYKGWSWLRTPQTEVCDPNGIETPRTLPFLDQANDPNLNDLMMGDDPNAHHTEEISENDEGFLPVSVHEPRAKRKDVDMDDFDDDDSFEGSGSDDTEGATKAVETDIHSELYEGSGSELTEIPPMPKMIDLDDDDQNSNETQSAESESDELLLAHAPKTLNESEVSAATEAENENENNSTVLPAVEEAIVPVKSATNDAEYIAPNSNEKDGAHSESAKVDPDEAHVPKNTYILLGVLGVLLVVLILYVAAKRSKTNTKNRRNNNDIESPAQEMLTMDKNNLGKPMQSPGEFIPLIPEKHEGDKKGNLCNGEEPLLQKLTEVENENDDGNAKKSDNKQQTPTQQLNGSAKPIPNGVQNGLHPDNKSDDNTVNDQRQYQPISPKASRYSPVSIFVNIIIQSFILFQFLFSKCHCHWSEQ